MKFVLRMGAALVAASILVACGSGSGGDSSASPSPTPTPTPFPQEAFNKSFATYLTAAGANFQGFSTDTALFTTSDCKLDNAGQAGTMVECKIDEYQKYEDATKTYTAYKGYLEKALPSGARGGEQKDAQPNTPFRYAAISGQGAVVLVLTKSDTQWVVGFVFQKAPN